LEDTVLVAQAVSPNGQFLGERKHGQTAKDATIMPGSSYLGCGRVKVASGQAPETAVSEGGVAFLFEDVFHGESKLLDTFGVLILQAKIKQLSGHQFSGEHNDT
jgi:hypothetical protein